MIGFVLGLIIGCAVGYVACALLSGSEDGYWEEDDLDD